MKRFGFFMAFLLLTLSCMPCGDDFLSVPDGKTRSEISKRPLRNQDHKDTDTCPPFCQCSCCATFSINDGIQAVSITDQGALPNYYSHLSFRVQKMALPIWQPPQLV
ncbi:DUF6660 family protein [Flavitalea flava]